MEVWKAGSGQKRNVRMDRRNAKTLVTARHAIWQPPKNASEKEKKKARKKKIERERGKENPEVGK